MHSRSNAWTNSASECGNANDEEGDLAEPAGDLGQGVAEVDLGLAGAMDQGDEDLAADPLEVADDLLHGRIAALVALGRDPVEDQFGGMPLLPGEPSSSSRMRETRSR